MPSILWSTRTGAFGRLFAFWALLFLASFPLVADPCAPPAGLQETEVRRVVDGDTLQLRDGTRVRMIGLDAPELGRDGAPDEPLARVARDHLHQLVALSNQRVLMRPGTEPRDRYGRTLALVYTARHGDLAAHLIENGLALVAIVPPNLDGVRCHQAAESKAQAAGRGLWGLSPGPVAMAAALDRTGFAIVEGQASHVYDRRTDRMITMDGNLVLRFRKDDIDRWFQAGQVEGYAGRRLRVRGWVHPWGAGGRAITVQHPATIEIIPN